MRCCSSFFLALLLLFQFTFSEACEAVNLTIKFKEKQSTIKIEIADTQMDREKGLMFRQNLGLTSGMLFIYEKAGEARFWMKNTFIPLDIAFANSDGVVVSMVHDTKPLSLDLINGGENIKYVLEINAGSSKDLHLFEGSRLIHPKINPNLKSPCS